METRVEGERRVEIGGWGGGRGIERGRRENGKEI